MVGDLFGEKLDDLMEYFWEWYCVMVLVGWYDGYRGFIDEGMGYYGYWFWEVGVIVYFYDIDDSVIMLMYYLKDLVVYVCLVVFLLFEGIVVVMIGRFCCEVGYVCLYSGWWSMLVFGYEFCLFW